MTAPPAPAPSVRRWWCEWAWLGDERPSPGVVLEAADDRLRRVLPGVTEAPEDATVLAGLTIPGLANAHSHAFHRALRARTQGGEGSFWTWRELMYSLAERLDPSSLYRLATAAFAEMALAGITTVGEFHYLHHQPSGAPYDDPNAMGEAIIAAAAVAGVRLTLIDTCYLSGGIGRPLEGVQRRFGDAGADGWAARVGRLSPGPRVHLAAAIHSVRAVPPAAMRTVGAWAAAGDHPLHVHLSEQPRENEECLVSYGVTPAGLLASSGVLTSRTVAVHATHLTDADVALLGQAGAGVCLCPTTERDLADGIGPARRLADAGCRLSLGSDSNAVIDLLEEARLVELDERLASGRRGLHTAASLLAAATAGGANALGWPESGRLAPGALADFTTIGLGGVRLAGIDEADAVAAAVFSASAADITQVTVGAEPVVISGRHLGVEDVAGASAAAIKEAWRGR